MIKLGFCYSTDTKNIEIINNTKDNKIKKHKDFGNDDKVNISIKMEDRYRDSYEN
jgi:hypothetical protein